MSYLTTGLDLKIDALTLAGEPTNGTSDFEASAYEWLTVVQRSLVSGGMFGPSFLQPCDWFWARAWPRGAIQLVQPYNQAGTISVSFTLGSRSVFVNTAGATPDLTGYRILKTDTPARHIIERVNNFLTPNEIQLREPWSGATDFGATDWLAYPDTYQLPADFVRGTSPLFLYGFPSNLPTTQTVDVIDPVDLERIYPQCFPWAQGTQTIGGGLPVMAARVNQDRLRFSHFLNTPNTATPTALPIEPWRIPESPAPSPAP